MEDLRQELALVLQDLNDPKGAGAHAAALEHYSVEKSRLEAPPSPLSCPLPFALFSAPLPSLVFPSPPLYFRVIYCCLCLDLLVCLAGSLLCSHQTFSAPRSSFESSWLRMA